MSIEQKVPFAVSISNLIQNKLGENEQAFGFQLPCRVIAVDGAIVTVNFEIDTNGEFTFPPVTCPIAQSTYIRLPVQVGDLGMCIAANARLGGVTGLGQGLAPLGLPFNLGALVYVPIGNADWSTVDPNAVNINAPNGVVLRDTNNNCTITLLPSGVTVSIGSTSLVVNSTGVTVNGKFTVNGDVATTGALTNNGISVGSTHKHSGVQTGGSNTGNPV
jgi:hypothetical protein